MSAIAKVLTILAKYGIVIGSIILAVAVLEMFAGTGIWGLLLAVVVLALIGKNLLATPA